MSTYLHHYVGGALKRTLLIAIAAAAISAAPARPAAAAAPTKAAAYAFDSDRTLISVSFRVYRSRVDRIALHLPLPCSNGREGFAIFIGLGVKPPQLPIARDGSFSGAFAAGEEPLDPFVVSEQFWLSGRVSRRGKTARVTLRAQQVGEAGTVCDSRARTVTARRR